MIETKSIFALEPGMKLARAVHNDAGAVLADAGVVLTQPMIDGFDMWGVMAVDVDIPEQPNNAIADPRSEALSNPVYVTTYQQKLSLVHDLFDHINDTLEVDVELVKQIVDGEEFASLYRGPEAITQLHNMERSDDYFIHHALNVAILAGLLGKWLKFSKEKRRNLTIAGLLLDIGMLQVPLAIRQKSGKLDDNELKVMRRHAQLGAELVDTCDLGDFPEIGMGVRQHHERGDGSGYPRKINRDRITEFGRILAFLDIYDAMASHRVYAKRNSPFDVFKAIYDDILNEKLDSTIGVLFINHVCHSLNGAWVRLSNGQKGKIVYIDDSRISSLPIVQTEDGKFINLDKESDIKLEFLLTYEEAVGLGTDV